MINPKDAEKEIKRQKRGKKFVRVIYCPNCGEYNWNRLRCKKCGLRFEKPYVHYADPLLKLMGGLTND